MTRSTSENHKHPNRGIIHHARQPHGIALIVAVLFILGWLSWTFIIW